jgi:O-antigen/teichoic acid export membrane protein
LSTIIRLRELTKDSVIYGIGGAVGNGISFFLLPVYTRIFSPADYGTIEMMSVIVSLLTAFLVMGMDSAQSFYFFEQKLKGKQAQKIMVSAILQWRLTWGLGMVVLAGALAPFINMWFLGGELPWVYFAVSFSGALFATVMSQSVEIFRLLYRPWSYIVVTMLNTILGAGLILLFVLVFKQGILGFFLGSAFASLVIAFVGWYLVREYLDFSAWHWQWWNRLLRFGAPLLPAGLGFYMMSSADRWFIQHYHGETALGLYAVGAKFAGLMVLLVDTFRKAWWPIAMDAMHSDDGPETFRMIARLYIGLGVAAVIYLTFLAPWLVKGLTGPAFHDAYPIVGILAWQALFYGFYLIGAAGIWKAEKTYITAILMAIAGVINLLFNYLLVPSFGGTGAALATVVSYFVWILLSLIISERFWKVQFSFYIMAGQILVGVFAVILLTLNPGDFRLSAALAHAAVIILVVSAFQYSTWQVILKRVRVLFV